MKKSNSIVIIPTYNEKENIENIIRAVLALEDNFNILVIDDGSPDGTAAIVKGLMESEFNDRLFIVERTGKLGLGTAYITGFKWCIEHGYDYVFEMDADFSHAPSDLPRLLSACRDPKSLSRSLLSPRLCISSAHMCCHICLMLPGKINWTLGLDILEPTLKANCITTCLTM